MPVRRWRIQRRAALSSPNVSAGTAANSWASTLARIRPPSAVRNGAKKEMIDLMRDRTSEDQAEPILGQRRRMDDAEPSGFVANASSAVHGRNGQRPVQVV